MALSRKNTETAIANEALVLLGVPEISDIDEEQNSRARACRNQYVNARDTIQTEYEWNCLQSWVDINAANDASPHPYYGYAYRIPQKYTRIVTIRGAEKSWEKLKGFVYCNIEGSASIKVGEIVASVADWDLKLRPVIVLYLASLIGSKVDAGDDDIQRVERKLLRLTGKLKRVDANEKGVSAAAPSSWVNSRRGRGAW